MENFMPYTRELKINEIIKKCKATGARGGHYDVPGCEDILDKMRRFGYSHTDTDLCIIYKGVLALRLKFPKAREEDLRGKGGLS